MTNALPSFLVPKLPLRDAPPELRFAGSKQVMNREDAEDAKNSAAATESRRPRNARKKAKAAGGPARQSGTPLTGDATWPYQQDKSASASPPERSRTMGQKDGGQKNDASDSGISLSQVSFPGGRVGVRPRPVSIRVNSRSFAVPCPFGEFRVFRGFLSAVAAAGRAVSISVYQRFPSQSLHNGAHPRTLSACSLLSRFPKNLPKQARFP